MHVNNVELNWIPRSPKKNGLVFRSTTETPSTSLTLEYTLHQKSTRCYQTNFDIGVGEFNVAEKYRTNGWLDIGLRNKMPNGAIVEARGSKAGKEWWQ